MADDDGRDPGTDPPAGWPENRWEGGPIRSQYDLGYWQARFEEYLRLTGQPYRRISLNIGDTFTFPDPNPLDTVDAQIGSAAVVARRQLREAHIAGQLALLSAITQQAQHAQSPEELRLLVDSYMDLPSPDEDTRDEDDDTAG